MALLDVIQVLQNPAGPALNGSFDFGKGRVPRGIHLNFPIWMNVDLYGSPLICQ
jgi:hypothetical protein